MAMQDDKPTSLRELRESRGISKNKLAAQVEVSLETLTRHELAPEQEPRDPVKRARLRKAYEQLEQLPPRVA